MVARDFKGIFMPRQLISSGSPFENQVGYSRAVVDGDWCFVAGTTGPDAGDGGYPDDVAEQARNALTIIESALAQGGFAMADIVRATYYITDAAYWEPIGPVLGAAFGSIRPAATCIVCGLIKDEMKIEIEVTAKRTAQ
jgi:enamine deaminase RidA (YjgF/YER057c/UK114 family)